MKNSTIYMIFLVGPNFFKALWAGLTNQRDILDFFTVTPLGLCFSAKNPNFLEFTQGEQERMESVLVIWEPNLSKYRNLADICVNLRGKIKQ